jgi:hypothetical protein
MKKERTDKFVKIVSEQLEAKRARERQEKSNDMELAAKLIRQDEQ